ncbi:hypothetical protein K0U07_05495 [bacterium]|nr:hypothetical protein [bacterium]
MKAKDLVIPSIVIVIAIAVVSQFTWTSEATRAQKKLHRAEIAEKKTKEFLEKSARGEVDVLVEKYDLEILQDQLDLHKKKLNMQE